ncbi:MAG TPA: hypothetical protein ACFYED_04180 [Candidatus Tripitaka californicus]|uniref:hypothetical protein n=1 Tax=Candidatus Tripitaka californicus TaxID=3367616 RepID=UPI00402655A1|nr:hypothetical protein [Planctomycetota bacterium]
MEIPKISLEKIPPFVKTLLPIVPLLIVFLLVNSRVLGAKAHKLEAAKGEENKLQLEIVKNKQKLVGFRPFSELEEKEVTETAASFQRLTKSLRTKREVYDKVTNRAVSCGIVDLSIDPSYRPSQAGDTIKVETQLGLDQYKSYMKLNFRCEFKSLGCFLEGLTGAEDYIIIESLTVKRELPRPGVELVLKLFTKS